MCGICGVLRLDGQPVPANTISKMSTTMAHRGPDEDRVWTSGTIGLGHRRLAIIDLSPAANQPMSNETGDILIVYNGEIYNYLNLRVDLEAAGHHFHSHSDTETVIHAYEEWGVDCLKYFNGHFAFAIWDHNKHLLFLARDRFGAKPLYYYYDGAKFLFASEIKAILAYPGVEVAVCYPALNEYFTFQNILTDSTLFEGIKLLPAGCFLEIDSSSPLDLQQQHYWDYDFSREPLKLSEEEASEELLRLFKQAVTRQLMSDVPLGCYLSGGMDSSSIAAVTCQQLGRLTTFTCGFDLSSASGIEMGFDERTRAEMLSNLLKTEHYEVVLHAGDMEHIMPELIWHLEDLRLGQSYPNYYVARLAGKFVKVVLSGAGGDELFAGYPWRYYRGIRSNGRDDYYRNYYNFWQRLVSDEDKSSLFNHSTYQQLSGHSTFDIFKDIIAGAHLELSTIPNFINASLYFEIKTFLHSLLVVEDKISMAHSLETRAPFLDNDLVDFALQLPVNLKLKNLEHIASRPDENDPGKDTRYKAQTGDGKVILRKTMQHLIPPETTQQIKQGFSAPDASWFRGESIDYVNSLLRNPRACIYEFLNPVYVNQRLDEHTSGQNNNRLFIWSLLSFEWWLKRFINN